jgi:hypothetical protein
MFAGLTLCMAKFTFTGFGVQKISIYTVGTVTTPGITVQTAWIAAAATAVHKKVSRLTGHTVIWLCNTRPAVIITRYALEIL